VVFQQHNKIEKGLEQVLNSTLAELLSSEASPLDDVVLLRSFVSQKLPSLLKVDRQISEVILAHKWVLVYEVR